MIVLPPTSARKTHRHRDLLDSVFALGFVEAGEVYGLERGVDCVGVDTEFFEGVTVRLWVRWSFFPSHTLGHQLCFEKPAGGDRPDRIDRVADALPLLVEQE